jgi:hypothetical protein
LEKTCPSVILSTTNLTWPDPEQSTGHHCRGGKPAINCMDYGTSQFRFCLTLMLLFPENKPKFQLKCVHVGKQ